RSEPPQHPRRRLMALEKLKVTDCGRLDEQCPKCGGVRVDVALITETTPEHMAVTCERCGHGWDRAPLDAPDQEKPPAERPHVHWFVYHFATDMEICDCGASRRKRPPLGAPP